LGQESDIAQLKASCSPDVANAVDLAALTGLRLGDLLRLSWSHIGLDAIEITTSKSRHRRTALIPIYEDLRVLLNRIPKRSPIVLTNARRKPWTANGFGTAFNRAKIAAGTRSGNLHFHDLRGTAVTRLYRAEVPMRAIAEIVAWEEKTVERIIRRYVGRTAFTQQLIRQINERRT
jgi:integrase